MNTEKIYKTIRNEITKDIFNYEDQIMAISKWIVSEFVTKKPKNLIDGYVRLYGAEIASDLNEIIAEDKLKERALKIYDEHTDEDAYYNYLKFLWVEYPNGNSLQLMEVIPLP